MRCSIVSPSSETVFDIAGKRAEKERLAAQMGQANFWDNQEKAQQIIQQLKPLNGLLNPYEDLERAIADAQALAELTEEDSTPRSGHGRRSSPKSRKASTISRCAPC